MNCGFWIVNNKTKSEKIRYYLCCKMTRQCLIIKKYYSKIFFYENNKCETHFIRNKSISFLMKQDGKSFLMIFLRKKWRKIIFGRRQKKIIKKIFCHRTFDWKEK